MSQLTLKNFRFLIEWNTVQLINNGSEGQNGSESNSNSRPFSADEENSEGCPNHNVQSTKHLHHQKTGLIVALKCKRRCLYS